MKQTCKEILERAQYLLDDEITFLTEEERQHIQAHLEDCQPCLERYGLEQEVKTVIGRLKGAERCPESLRVRITAIFRQA